MGEEAKNPEFLQPGKVEGRGRDFVSVYNCLLREHGEGGASLFLEVHDNKMRGSAHNLQLLKIHI